jgi:hypothetical protein
MMEQVEVFHLFPPLEPGIPSGPSEICNYESSDYSSTGSDNADAYEWIISPEEAGTLIADGTDLTVEWNTDFVGTAGISLFGVNECGEGYPTQELEVTVEGLPAPEVDGPELVCDFDIVEYSTPENDQCTYSWEVTGGTIVEGQGTYMVTVEWGEAGTGYLDVTEETLNGCTGSAESFEVTIDECTSVGEQKELGITKVYPNPVQNTLFIEINTETDQQVKLSVQNQLGQEVLSRSLDLKKAGESNSVDVSMLPKGLYIISISGKHSVVSQQFIKE